MLLKQAAFAEQGFSGFDSRDGAPAFSQGG